MLDVEVTPRAAIQIEAAATWWSKNRPAAPDAIRIDFQEATVLLSHQPGVGAKSSTARYPELRRLTYQGSGITSATACALESLSSSPSGMPAGVVVRAFECN